MLEGNFNIFYFALAVFAIGLTIKNIRQIKNLKHEREFANTYSKVLRQDEDAYEAVTNYLNTETNEMFKNKAKVLLIYEKMTKGEDPSDIIEDVNFDTMFKEKGSFSSKLANRNSDIFVWLTLVFAKARSLSMFDVIDKLSKKIEVYDENLSNHLEYKMYKGVLSALAERNDEDLNFLTKMLDGDYAGMVYEQRLVGLYKRIAASFLVYMGEKIDEYFENDLHSFAETIVGKCLMTDLEIYDKYPPIVEKKDEIKEEVKEENKEDNKEA